MRFISDELDSWLDEEYLLTIEDDLIELEDYIPKTIELHLPNYDKRSEFLDSNFELVDSDDFQNKQILDQMAMGTTWEERVFIFDDFFKRHPEFSGLIRDKKAYENWKLEEVPY